MRQTRAIVQNSFRDLRVILHCKHPHSLITVVTQSLARTDFALSSDLDKLARIQGTELANSLVNRLCQLVSLDCKCVEEQIVFLPSRWNPSRQLVIVQCEDVESTSASLSIGFGDGPREQVVIEVEMPQPVKVTANVGRECSG